MPAERADDLAALAAILACYRPEAADLGLAELITREFGVWPRPADDALLGCSPEHLAQCPECREALATFGEARWEDLAAPDLPLGYADAALLSDDARRYFLPAYLLAATRTRSTAALDELLSAGVAGREGWSALRRRLVGFVVARFAEPIQA